MLKGGIAKHKLPTLEELKRLRAFSSRELAMVVLDGLHGIENCCGLANYLNDSPACQEFVEKYKRTVLKAPWSTGVEVYLPILLLVGASMFWMNKRG